MWQFGSREAFTLLEVSIAITISLLVVGLAYGAFAFSSRVVAHWRSRTAVETQIHLMTRRLSQEVRNARGVQLKSPRSITLVSGGKEAITYHWEEGQLMRNLVPVSLEDAVIESASFATSEVRGRVRVAIHLTLQAVQLGGSPVLQEIRMDLVTRRKGDWERGSREGAAMKASRDRQQAGRSSRSDSRRLY